MKKEVLIILLLCLFLLLAVNVQAANSKSVVIQVRNPLPVPLTKTVTLDVPLSNLSAETNFALFYKGVRLPLQVLSRKDNAVRLRTVVSLLPDESKLLVLKYGDTIKGRYDIIFKPDFSGTHFVGIGSGKLYVTSLNNDNNIIVDISEANSPASFKLNKNESKIVSLDGRDVVFSINAQYPIFAELSSLKENCLKNSSDDVSSVYGTYFVLYIPREIVISAYDVTKVKLYSVSGKEIFSGTLPAKGQYENLNLKAGFYVISANKPVTVQFGCEDDNIYAINYGDINKFKGVSYGNIVCSALFPQTVVKIKTPGGSFPEITLEKSGDYIYKDLITNFKDKESELLPIYIEYSKPILVYSDPDHGNIGGEQIPSVDGENKSFVFLTGKIFNFDGLKHKRKVVIIPSEAKTHLLVNGNQMLLSKALSPKYLLFDKSYSLVKISADKPIAVFDVGMTTSLENLTMLIPIKDNSIFWGIGATVPGGANLPGSEVSSPKLVNNFIKFLFPVGAFFNNVWKSFQGVAWFKNTQVTFNEFVKNVTPSLRALSKQILALFAPVAGMIYPYIHPYLPNLTQSELAAVIFYMLIIFIIILLWPKHRGKRNVPVVKLKEADVKKKKSVAFNVKTIEEKSSSGIRYGAQGKPKTISPVGGKVGRPEISSEKLSSASGTAMSYPKVAAKGRSIAEEGAKEIQRKTISKVPVKPGAKEVVSPSKGKGVEVPLERKTLKAKKVELHKEVAQSGETEKETERKEALKKIIEKSKTAEISTKETKKQKESESPVTPRRKSIFSGIFHKKVGKVPKERAKVEKPLKEATSLPVIPAAEVGKEKEETRGEEKLEKHIEKEKPGKQTEEEVKVSKTSLDELLERVKKEIKSESVPLKEVSAKPRETAEEVRAQAKISVHLEMSVVMDKTAAEKVVYSSLIKHFSRTFISAREQPEIDAEKKSKYRIGIIALTPIELRIAEDLARRIGAKKSTGEALLIAKKVGVKQILVSDAPTITNYQGIRITNINEVIKE